MYGIRAAHTLGYHVFFSPLVNIHGTPSWAGLIQPATYEEQQQWFTSYWQILKPYVMAAAQTGVEQMAIGTEEEWLQNNAPDSLWSGLIANIRSVYAGTLTYDTNWSDLQNPPPAWMHNADLKMIGVSEYLSLVDTPMHVDPQQIPALWKVKVQAPLDNFATMLGKPIFLSEIGFRNSADTLYSPWDSKRISPADPEAQAAACDTALASSMSDPHILGSFFWGWDNVGALKLKGLPAVSILHNHYAPLHV
jgi:hypothetical protein